MRNKFDQELELLIQDLIEMGALVERAIGDAIEALTERDAPKAKRTMEMDSLVDDKEKEIERRCFKLLLQQQPVAADLRLISTALKMITDMERIGDQAQDIAEISLRLIDDGYTGGSGRVPAMAHEAAGMVTSAIDAYVAKDLQAALAVIEHDNVVDDLFVQVRSDLLGLIRQDTDLGGQALDLLMAAKYLERIGDHAVNIAGWVIFSITGEHGRKRVL